MVETIIGWPLELLRVRGRRVSPPPRGLVVHALHKSASMFLYRLFQRLAAVQDWRLYSVHNDPADHLDIQPPSNRSFVVCPIRSLEIERFHFPGFAHVQHLLQLRDPRDILVSEYYSLGWLHADTDWKAEDHHRRHQIQRMSIDDYARNEPELAKYPLAERLEPLSDLIQRDDVTVVRYEEMVLDFPTWLGRVLEATGDPGMRRWQGRLVRDYRDEFQPGGAGSHKRAVAPGDHRRQLSRETISILNDRFASTLELLATV